MNTFKRKALFVVAIAAAVLIGGCASSAHTEALKVAIEQQGKLDIEREKTRQEEAKARAARAMAIQTGMAKGEVASAVGVAILGVADITHNLGAASGREAKSEGVNPLLLALAKPPEDFLDKTLRVVRTLTGGAAELAHAASPFMLAREAGRTQRYLGEMQVQTETVRQSGETSRVVAIAGNARDVAVALATRPPTNTLTITAGRDVANDGATLTNTNTTVSTDVECSATGGAAAATNTQGTTGTQPATGGAAGAATNNCR